MALQKITQVHGRGVYVPGDDIDTDRIIPARYLRCVTFDGLGEHMFRDVRYTPDDVLTGTHPVDLPQHQGATVLLSDSNFGCGSSREHAPQAIYRFGFRAIIAVSFAEIFFGNSTTLGLPCISVTRQDIAQLAAAVEADPALELQIDLIDVTIRAGDLLVHGSLEASARDALLGGRWDPIAELLEGAPSVAATAARLTYLAAARG
jgi:3-isopropylmalate/(R)-2-methylmalate dehydratase small subunit